MCQRQWNNGALLKLSIMTLIFGEKFQDKVPLTFLLLGDDDDVGQSAAENTREHDGRKHVVQELLPVQKGRRVTHTAAVLICACAL